MNEKSVLLVSAMDWAWSWVDGLLPGVCFNDTTVGYLRWWAFAEPLPSPKKSVERRYTVSHTEKVPALART